MTELGFTAAVRRLRTDFQLSVITLLGVAALFGIVPFAVYRFQELNYLAGVADSLISAGIIASVIYAWMTGDTARTGFVLAVFCCVAGVVIGSILPQVGHLWGYPILVASFFLTRPTTAICLNTAMVVAIMIYGTSLPSGESLWAFFATATVVSACSFIFAIRNQHQRREMAMLARRDPLTGVRNRRSMDDALQLAVSTASRTGTPYALVMLDLDHFKAINDEHGHALGDEILVNLTKMVERSTRQSDQLFRFGGEEFVLLMPAVDAPGMKAVVQGLRQKIRSTLTSPDGPVTASFGAAHLEGDESWENWLKRADNALYQAKERGRDCVVIAGDDEKPDCWE
ncbi:GGDEF domain-containing protein [Salicola sp. Rm-C-2C1-2]|uniref:GGDEF domain-containing protein n=1 Tax=Salicola sp. Rm-C-2C1-2 TaxID=3141321 RepID=UPI0032E4244F